MTGHVGEVGIQRTGLKLMKVKISDAISRSQVADIGSDCGLRSGAVLQA
jgi:hypothetical protein